MESLTANLVLFLAFVVPGFLSMRIYGLLRPMEHMVLKDNILEAVAFSVVNFALMSWAIAFIVDFDFVAQNRFYTYILVVLTFFLAPIIWPVALFVGLNVLAGRRLILERSPTSWDHFFRRREPCWVMIHLNDGRRMGGWYGPNSYASSHPNAGHIYVEQLWTLDENGRFLEKIPQSRGLILRPGDYAFVELFEEALK